MKDPFNRLIAILFIIAGLGLAYNYYIWREVGKSMVELTVLETQLTVLREMNKK